MRLHFLLNTDRAKEPIPPRSRERVRTLTLRFAALLVILGTLWVVIASIAYPLYWFEFIFKNGFRNWSVIAYQLTYDLHHIPWALFGFPAAILVTCLLRAHGCRR
jgi:hypothetical protein